MNHYKFKFNNNMKNSIKGAFCKFGLMLFLAMFSIAGKAQVGQYTMSISSATATSNTIDVSLSITVTNPAAGMRFGGFSTGINYNTAIVNGGTISASYVGGKSPELSSLNTAALNTATSGQIRLPIQSLTGANGVDMAQGTTLSLGTYRITNSVPWTTGNANLWLQNVLTTGKTNSLVNGYPYGATTPANSYTTTITTTLNSVVVPTLILGYTQAAPLSLPVGQICATSGTAAVTNPSCFGGTGSAAITLSPSPFPAISSVSYTVDGGASQTASVTSGNSFSVSGLSTGSHTIAVSVPGCSTVTVSATVNVPTQLVASASAGSISCFGGSTTVSVSATGGTAPYTGTGSFTVSAGAYSYTVTDAKGCSSTTTGTVSQPAQLTNSTTISACGSYTWSVNGQTYATSGTYTATNTSGACSVLETLQLTVTPNTTQTTTVAACDNYTWSANGQTYTSSGTYSSVLGCVTRQLVLTINTGTTEEETVSGCDSYTWANTGTTYTESGDYPGDVTTNPVTGCTVDHILHLTINASSVYYADADSDGYGNASSSTNACSQPVGYVSNSTDCNDSNSSVNPAATEVANGIDDNCNGTVDEGTTPSAPGVTNLTLCKGAASVTLTATAYPGYTLRWYTVATAGTASLVAPSATTTALGVKSYWVSQKLGSGVESPRALITVTVVAIPATPLAVSGTAAICSYVGSTTELTYSIAPVVGATSYVWTVPTGANIVSGQGSTSVVVNFSGVAQGTTALTLGVQSVNSNGCLSVAKTLSLTRVLPVAPASVVLTNPASATPATAITAVGPYIGTTTPLTLTAALTATANSYSWTLPAGVNVVSGNPATDRVLIINFANAASGTTSITASVISVSGCGNSIAKALVLTKVLPAKPAAITTTQANVCLIAGSSSTVTYTVAPVAGAFANGYTWTVPTGASIVGSATGASIVVSYSSNFNAAGSVTVTSSNGVGTSATAATLAIAATAPVVPATLVMTLPPSATAVAAAGPYMATSTELTLTAAPVAGAVSYAWTLPAGVNQVSGGTSNVITVNFANVSTPTGTTALAISVKAVNGCGLQSTAKVLSLTRALPAAPAAISTTLANVCSIAGTNATATYSVASVAGAFANGYTWTVPTGATIVSGQGSTSISVSYASNFTAGNITVTSSNGVGTSLTPATLAVARTSGAVAPAALVGQVAGLCAGTAYNYSFVAGANAQTYTITGPVGSIVTSADNASNTSNTITTSNVAFTVVYPTSAIVNISIVASNPCGSAAAKTFAVSKTMAAITTLSGPTTVDACTTYTYTASAVAGAVSYTWTVPANAVIVSQSLNTLVVSFPGTLPTGAAAALKVFATNSCGLTSAIKSITLTRIACPIAKATMPEVVSAPFSVKAYPNPSSDVFNFSLTTSSQEKVSVKVYDMTGKLVDSREVAPNEVSELQVGDRYPSGVYNMIVTQGDNTKTLRVIKR